jgi:hypothetical protein
MENRQAPARDQSRRSRLPLKAAMTVAVVLLAGALCLFFSPREYLRAHRAPDCVSPLVSLFHKPASLSIIVTHCLLSQDPARQVHDWYYTSSRLTVVDIPGYPYWRIGPLTVTVYLEVEMPPPEILGGDPDLGQTAIISRTYYGVAWRQ